MRKIRLVAADHNVQLFEIAVNDTLMMRGTDAQRATCLPAFLAGDVGISGVAANRFSLSNASAFNLPALTWTLVVAVDRNAAQRPHETAHRPVEQAVLANEADLASDRVDRAKKDEEIPVGSMRSAHDDELAVGREGAGDVPAAAVKPLQQQPTDKPFEPVEIGIGVYQPRT